MSRHCWYWLCAVTTAVSIASDYSTVIPKRVAWLFFGLYTWVISKVLHTVRFLFKNGFILQNTFTSLQCNLHCALSQRSNVWASLVLLSGRLRCWWVWLLGSPHYTPPQCFWSVSHRVVSSILGTSQRLVGSCQTILRVGKHLPSILFQNFRYCTWGMRPRVNVWSLVTARDLTTVSLFFHFKPPFRRTETT